MAKSQRGFAGMDPAAQREIARAGGRAAHQSGHAHEFTPEEAAEAGRKGGRARHHKSAQLQQDAAVHRQTAKPDEAGEMENAEQHLAENNGEATGFHREAAERNREAAPDKEAFEGDGQVMTGSRRGIASQPRERAPGMMSGDRSSEASGQARMQSGTPRAAGQRERTDAEDLEGAAQGTDNNPRFGLTNEGEETGYGDSDDARTGDVELLGGSAESRTSAARRGPGSETEDED